MPPKKRRTINRVTSKGLKMSSGTGDNTPWDDFLSDFTLILDSGERIKCHKLILARASSVLKTMMTTDMTEAMTKRREDKSSKIYVKVLQLRTPVKTTWTIMSDTMPDAKAAAHGPKEAVEAVDSMSPVPKKQEGV